MQGKGKKEKVVEYESLHSMCYTCKIQIGVGNKYEWVKIDTLFKMVHPNCQGEQKDEMKAKCYLCSNMAESTNISGNWVCKEHAVETKVQNKDINLNDLAKELKKYITLEDLDTIIEVRKKLDNINIEEIIVNVGDSADKITRAINDINHKVEIAENIIEEQRKKTIPQIFEIKLPDRQFNTIGKHYRYPELITYIVNRKDVFLNGPAGAGKNTAVEQAAKDLDMPLQVLQLSQLSLKSELTGYKNIVNNDFIPTTFTNSYENGGIFFADEFDNWAPSVVTSVNMAIANNFYEFSKGTIRRHKDFVFIAAGNTIGMGAESHYVTSRALSGATRDRFRFLHWPIDNEMEMHIVPKEYHHWVRFVQEARKLAANNGSTILITPRASIQGAQDLAMGFSKKHCIEAILLRNIETPSYLISIIEKYLS